jgi:3-methyladenine DNA glycosylase Tag
MACFTERAIERLLGDAGILRHRSKIVSAINNAARAIALKHEFGSLAAYFCRHELAPAGRGASRGEALRAVEASSMNPFRPLLLVLASTLAS